MDDEEDLGQSGDEDEGPLTMFRPSKLEYTYVLFSVPNIDPVLREVLRVLAPGGKFYFLEHIAEFDLVKHGLRKKIQNVLDRVCVWYFIFNGCHLSRDTLAHIERTGFSSVDAQKYHAPVSSIIFDVDSPCVQGIAVK
ncbi:thiol S-methyltransferase TMT1A-like [Panulirus ornatus]|uniref:thiol S-methyltransferase TMT1A-like n=1 Tax=Panulirus ornatus TaxID=150431 RepID=UPI003A8A2929